MDVSRNPAPWETDTSWTDERYNNSSETPPSYQTATTRLLYSRNSIFRLRHYPKSALEKHIFKDLKSSGLFKYRGKRGSGHKIDQYAISTLGTFRRDYQQRIPVRISNERSKVRSWSLDFIPLRHGQSEPCPCC